MKSTKPHLGLTLIELMIAIAISAVLLAGVATVYTSNKRASSLNNGLSRLQENLRLVADFVAQDVRMAGYVGCRGTSITSALNNPAQAEYDITKPIRGYEGDSSTTSFPSEITNASNPAQQKALIGSDALLVLHGKDTDLKVTSSSSGTNVTSKNPSLVHIQKDDVVILSDCIHAGVAQVTNDTAASASIIHSDNASTQGPGNCYNGMAPISGPLPACGPIGNFYAFGARPTRVMLLSTNLYYVAKSVSGLTTSLYRLSLDKGTMSKREELIEGVESMQVLYGEDMTGDNIADRYVDAANVTNWDNISSVRVGFLIATPTAARNAVDKNSYTIATNTIAASTAVTSTTFNGGAVVHPEDKKLRLSYTTTIKLRNKGVM